MKNRMKRLFALLLCLTALLLSAGCAANQADGSSPQTFNSADELAGKTIAVVSGGAVGGMVEKYFDGDVTLEYFNTNADMAVALKTGKVDAYAADIFAARLQCETYTDQKVLEDTPIQVNHVGFFFKKNDARATELCNQMNEMLAEFKEEGKLSEIEEKWTGSDDVDIDIELSGENGTLTYTCCTSIGKPFCFVKNSKIVGYEIELVYLFCERYGYGLTIVDSSYGGMLSDVAAGKSDFGGTATSITPERQEQCLFSDPSLTLKFVLAVNGDDSGLGSGFIAEMTDGFQKTFIEDNRYQLFLNGIGETLLIALLSIIFGTLLGYLVFLLCFGGNRVANLIVRICMKLIHGLPVVVLLMVFYYVIFGSSGLNGTEVSIIAFTFIFAAAFTAMLNNSYNAIDPGQMEAAYAMGYSKYKALRKRILPQMAEHFMPVFENEVVGLVQATAIVGYIAVTDLTKVGDIIRGVTYEAFYPIIATAVIYFVLGILLSLLVRAIARIIRKRKRSEKTILRGVVQHDSDQ